jgi:tetrahydromethanopterin S-methyltransferase subunit B
MQNINTMQELYDRIKNVVNLHAARIETLEAKEEVISKNLKNAILNDFDNLFQRVQKLEEAKPDDMAHVAARRLGARNVELEKKLAIAIELRDEYLNQSVAAEKAAQFWKQRCEAFESADMRNKELEAQVTLEQDKLVTDLKKHLEASQQLSKEWQKEALQARVDKAKLQKDLEEMTKRYGTVCSNYDTLAVTTKKLRTALIAAEKENDNLRAMLMDARKLQEEVDRLKKANEQLFEHAKKLWEQKHAGKYVP